jgi:hypothetical protein
MMNELEERMNSEQPQLRSNPYFDAYLTYHHLSLPLAAQLAGIRLMSVWRIQHDLPVHFHTAAALRIALFKRTGIAYLAPIPIRQEPANQNHRRKKEEQPVDEQDTHHLRAFRLLGYDKPGKSSP